MKSDKTTPNVPTLRFQEFTNPWTLMPLKKLLCFQNGINADSAKYGKGVKFISVSDILNNQYITYDCIKGMIDIDKKTMERFLVEYGDILFQRSSETFEDIGRANVYLDKEHPATFGGFVIRGKKISEYNPMFFRYLLCTPNARKQTVRMGAGAQHYNIGQDGLGKISLYFPTIQEQQKIAGFLSAIDDRIAVQNKIISKYETLIKGLCDMIFPSIEGSILPLKAIVNIEKGQQINGMSLAKTGKYYYLNGGIAPSGYIDDYNTSEETISISEGGNSCGFVSYNLQKFWSGGHCYTLKIMAEQCRSKYLFFYLKYKEKNIMQLRVGSGLPNIQKKSLENFNVKLPNYKKQCFVERIFEVVTAKKEIENALLERFQSQKETSLDIV